MDREKEPTVVWLAAWVVASLVATALVCGAVNVRERQRTGAVRAKATAPARPLAHAGRMHHRVG